MIAILQVEVSTIAACILLILIHQRKRSGLDLLDERLFQILLYSTFLYAIADAVAWILDGTTMAHMQFTLYMVNMLSYLFCVLIPYLWTIYVEFRLYENEDKLWKMNRFLIIPVLLFSMLLISTPYTGLMFHFDSNQMYHRGPLFVLQVIFSLFYMIFPTIRALLRMPKLTSSAQRQDCLNISKFILFPLIGLLIQVLFYGIPAAVIATVISELTIFINLQNKQISLDALTGLNNRGQLNRYLHIQSNKEARKGNLYMLVLDIDHFKHINDTYGHKAGDEALIDMATILQKVCGRRGGFLSRYGGDEFAIVIETKSHIEVDQLVDNIYQELQSFNESGQKEYKLFTSIGYALYGTNATQTVDQLLEAADSKMYQVKQNHHADGSK